MIEIEIERVVERGSGKGWMTKRLRTGTRSTDGQNDQAGIGKGTRAPKHHDQDPGAETETEILISGTSPEIQRQLAVVRTFHNHVQSVTEVGVVQLNLLRGAIKSIGVILRTVLLRLMPPRIRLKILWARSQQPDAKYLLQSGLEVEEPISSPVP